MLKKLFEYILQKIFPYFYNSDIKVDFEEEEIWYDVIYGQE